MRQVPIAPRYWATEDGRIWDEQSQRWKAQCETGIPAYKYTTIYFPDGTRKLTRVHRLVCMAWHENPEDLPMVDHIDRDKMNNHKDNLRWATRSQNQQNATNNVVEGGLRLWIRENCPKLCTLEYDRLYMRMWKFMQKNPTAEISEVYSSCTQ
jgi:hypothetical protein